jgi:integrase
MPAKSKAYKLDTPTARARLDQRWDPYFVRIERGLHLGYRRGTQSGNWVARMTRPGGKMKTQKLGQADDGKTPADGVAVFDFDQAVIHCRDWRQKMAREAGEIAAHALTVGDAVDEHIQHLYVERSHTTAYSCEKRMTKHLPKDSTLAKTPVVSVTFRQITAWLRGMVNTDLPEEKRRAAMNSANRCLSILRAALTKSAVASEGEISDAGWRNVKAFEKVNVSRKIFLTDAEARRLIAAAPMGQERDLIEAGFTTACRFGELAQAKVGDIDFNSGLWHVAKSKTGPRTTILTTDALALFRRIIPKAADPNNLIFQHPDGKEWNNHNIRPVMKRIVKASGLDPQITFYTARHSAISWMLAAGVPVQAIGENCGTSTRMIEKVYGKFAPETKRNLLDGGMPSLASADVIPMNRDA